MSDQKFLEAMVNFQQVHIGISIAVSLGVAHYDDGPGDRPGISRIMSHPDEIVRALRDGRHICIADPDKILNTGSGVPVGYTVKRWVARGDYAQAAQLLGAQTVDVMRQVLKK